MPKRKSVDAVLSEAEQIARVWAENSSFALSGVTLAEFQSLIAQLRALQTATDDLRTRLTGSVNETASKALTVTEVSTRARTAMRGFFGPDSTQYEQAGGTRRSERRTRARKTADAPPQ